MIIWNLTRCKQKFLTLKILSFNHMNLLPREEPGSCRTWKCPLGIVFFFFLLFKAGGKGGGDSLPVSVFFEAGSPIAEFRVIIGASDSPGHWFHPLHWMTRPFPPPFFKYSIYWHSCLWNITIKNMHFTSVMSSLVSLHKFPNGTVVNSS